MPNFNQVKNILEKYEGTSPGASKYENALKKAQNLANTLLSLRYHVDTKWAITLDKHFQKFF